MDLNANIGTALRNERSKRKLSLAEVADRMGYSSRNTVSKIELGTTQITVEQLQKYCDAVGCSWVEILEKVSD